MKTKYVILTYFNNGTVYCYSYNDDATMFNYVGGALNYNKNIQPSSPTVTDVQVFTIDVEKKGLTLIHDIEVSDK